MTLTDNNIEATLISLAAKISGSVDSEIAEVFGKSISDRQQLNIIVCIDELKIASPSSIAEHTKIERPRVTVLLDALEKDSKIERVRDDIDRRRVVIKLLPSGVEIAKEYKKILRALPQHLTSSLSVEERKALAIFLKSFPQ